MNFLDKFTKLRELEAVEREISEQRRMLAQPLLSDYDLLPRIKDIIYADDSDIDMRKVFICVALFLYAPGALMGKKMPRYLRTKIGECVGIKPKCAPQVSNIVSNLLLEYTVYKGFRDNVDFCYNKVIAELL